MEIERKFLVKYLPSEAPAAYIELEQGYICTSPVIRFRSMKKNTETEPAYVLTIKGKGFVAREEHELSLSREQYEKLRERKIGSLVRKTRYLYPLTKDTSDVSAAPQSGDFGEASADLLQRCPFNTLKKTELTAEVDVFDGDQKGLIMAEVEFPDRETCGAWEKPDWLGKEVSADGRYHNSTMISENWRKQFTPEEIEEWKIHEYHK